MQDIFYEESARIVNEKSEKFKYYLFLIFAALSIIASVIWFLVVYFYFDLTKGNLTVNIILIVLPFLIFIISAIVCFRIKNNFYVEYDYTFISGSVRIDKVIKNVKRKPLYCFESKNVVKLGKFGSDEYFKLSANPDIEQDYLTSNNTVGEGKDLFYLCINLSGNKKLLILECTEQFCSYILKFAGRNILEENYQ